MKHIALKFSKRFIAGMLMAGMFIFIPSVFNFVWDSTARTYYEHTPVSEFLNHKGIVFEDMCYGDTEHLAQSARTVRHEEGYRANISRELYELQREGVFAKLYEQEGIDVIIEYTDGEAVYRVQTYDEPLDIGKYYWQIRINSLVLPLGVTRYDVPAIQSNVFEVKQCEGNLYDRT